MDNFIFRNNREQAVHALFNAEIAKSANGAEDAVMDSSFIKEVNNQTLSLDYRFIDVKDRLSGGETIQVIDTNRQTQTNLYDLQRGALPENQYSVVNALLFRYSAQSSEVQADSISYTNAIYPAGYQTTTQVDGEQFFVPEQVIPTELLNAEFVLQYSNRTIYRALGKTIFHFGTTEGPRLQGYGIIPLFIYKVLKPDIPMQLTIRTARGAGLSDEVYHYLQFGLGALTSMKTSVVS